MKLFKNINTGKKAVISKEYPEFDNEAYKEESDLSDFIENKDISENTRLALGCFGLNGIYLFFVTRLNDEDAIKAEIQATIHVLNLLVQNIVIFIRSEDKDYYYDGKRLIEKEYLLDCYTNIYKNTQLSAMTLQMLDKTDEELMADVYEEAKYEDAKTIDKDAKWYVANRVSSAQLNLIYNNISQYERPDKQAKEIEIDGVKFVKRAVKTKIFGYSYGEQYFPVSTTDPNKFFLITLLGGLFGLHKIVTKEYDKAFLYFISCGGFGISYFLDIVSIITGGYFINQVNYVEDEEGNVEKEKTRIYLDKLSFKPYQLAGVFIAAALAFVMVKFVYFNAIISATKSLTITGIEQLQEYGEKNSQIYHEKQEQRKSSTGRPEDIDDYIKGGEIQWQDLLNQNY